MEEDIKILTWFADMLKYNNQEMYREARAIENLIKGYRELEEENKKYKNVRN